MKIPFSGSYMLDKSHMCQSLAPSSKVTSIAPQQSADTKWFIWAVGGGREWERSSQLIIFSSFFSCRTLNFSCTRNGLVINMYVERIEVYEDRALSRSLTDWKWGKNKMWERGYKQEKQNIFELWDTCTVHNKVEWKKKKKKSQLRRRRKFYHLSYSIFFVCWHLRCAPSQLTIVCDRSSLRSLAKVLGRLCCVTCNAR